MKALLYNTIASLNKIIDSLTRKLTQQESFVIRLPYALTLFILYLVSAGVNALAILFLSSATSFEFFHPLNQQRGYTGSFTQYNSWRRRVQVSAVSSTIVVIAITILNGLFFTQEKSFAANFTVNCSGTSSAPTVVTESNYNSGDIITFADTGGDGYCVLDQPLDVGPAGSVTIQTGVVLAHSSSDSVGIDITTGALTIEVGASLDANYRGCLGGQTSSEDGQGPNETTGICATSESGAGGGAIGGGGGAGHAGNGGNAVNPNNFGVAYGDSSQPMLLGAGGGAAVDTDGGDGGGAIRLDVSGTLTIDGTITSNGEDGEDSTNVGGGGASGGSVFLSTNNLTGAGTITAQGGVGGDATGNNTADGGGGSGGRVVIEYESSAFSAESIFVNGGTVAAGSNNAGVGAAGSILLLDTDDDDMTLKSSFDLQSDGDYTRNTITINNGTSVSCEAMISTLNFIATDTIAFDNVNWTCTSAATINFGANNWTMTGANTMDWSAVGGVVNWDIQNDVNIQNLTYTGGSASTTQNGGILNWSNPINITLTNSTIDSSVQWEGISSLTIDADSSISASDKGCDGGSGPNGNGYGPDEGNNAICTITTAGYGDGTTLGAGEYPGGAGYGGAGGASYDGVISATYGDQTTPTLPGSGGGASGGDGGRGGGIVRISTPVDTGIINVLGSINALGATGASGIANTGGGGSGGSIYITTGVLTGSGTFSVDGGAGGEQTVGAGARSGSGGGGGRVALYTNGLTTEPTHYSRDGGVAGAGSSAATAGAQGSLYTFDYTAPNMPTVLIPADNATGVSKTPTITTGIYNDIDGGTHTSTDWIIYDTNDCSGAENSTYSTYASSDLDSHVVSPALEAHTEYSVAVRYTDEVSLDSEFSSCISFTTLNAIPVAAIDPVSDANEDDETVSLDASSSTDADTDTLTYEWVELSDTASACDLADTTSATPDVTISNTDANYSCQYEVTVDDGFGGVDTDSVTFNVVADDDAPIIENITNKTIEAGSILTFEVSASDPDTDEPLTLSISDQDGSFADSGVTASSLFTDNGDNSGEFTWVTASDMAGIYVAAFNAFDGTSTTAEVVTITVEEAGGTDPGDNPGEGEEASLLFSGALPNISFSAGTTTQSLFDLDEYFSQSEGAHITYSSFGQQNITVLINDSGQVTMSAPASFAGSESITFRADDGDGHIADSNSIVVSVSEDTETNDDIDHVTGTSKGRGVVTVYNTDNDIIAQWQAFRVGGVVPRLGYVNNQSYVITVKRRSGSTTHAYTSQGTILKKKRLSPKLHYRKIATGKLDNKGTTIEIVVATKRGDTIYFKIFSFNPEKRQIVLRKRAKYQPIQGKKYRVSIQKERIKLINKNGQTKFIWRPFP